jgi:hypothetical protein
VTTTWPLLWLLAQAAAAAAPPAEGTAAAPPTPDAPAPAPAAPPPPTPAPPPPPPRAGRPPPPLPPSMATPFRLSLTYLRVLREDGELARPNMAVNAIGFDMAFPSSNYVRNHLGVAHQWESQGPYSARGFRIDLVSLGYPINLYTSASSAFRLDLEPIITVVRGEIMFVNGGGRILRVESGFSLEISATLNHWFLTLQAFGIDFRYWVYTSDASVTGFTRVFPLRAAIGHEF